MKKYSFRIAQFNLAVFFSIYWLCNFLFADNILTGSRGGLIEMRVISDFDSPWAMSFIDTDRLLVTSKKGKLWLVSTGGNKVEVLGVPKVKSGGQGGLGDIILHPNFESNGLIYLSYVEQIGFNTPRGAVVVKGELELSEKPRVKNLVVIWKQIPKTGGSGHFSYRLVFGEEGSEHQGKLFISSGDRQLELPAQQWNTNLGKIIRINEDGTIPSSNPYKDRGDVAKTFWTIGHRNVLGIAFDNNGQLWAHEMGPKHGDELNLIIPGKNYGWPLVSEGNHYDGRLISNHKSRPEFFPPKVFWVPTIAPSGLLFYDGSEFPQWKNNAFLGGLRSEALIRLKLKGLDLKEEERFQWGSRVREVELSNDGSIWVLEDGPKGRLIQFVRPK